MRISTPRSRNIEFGVRTLLREQRFDMQRQKTVEVVRQLHRNGARLPRRLIEVGMREAGMTLKDPRLRKIAFAERADLEGGGISDASAVQDCPKPAKHR